MGEEKEILLRGKVCAYLTCRLMGDPVIPLLAAHAAVSFNPPSHTQDLEKASSGRSHITTSWLLCEIPR